MNNFPNPLCGRSANKTNGRQALFLALCVALGSLSNLSAKPTGTPAASPTPQSSGQGVPDKKGGFWPFRPWFTTKTNEAPQSGKPAQASIAQKQAAGAAAALLIKNKMRDGQAVEKADETKSKKSGLWPFKTWFTTKTASTSRVTTNVTPGSGAAKSAEEKQALAAEEKRLSSDFLMDAFPKKALLIADQLRMSIAQQLEPWVDNKAIFYGPRGTGKSSLIRKMAREAGCEYVQINSSELVSEYQGSGSQNVRRHIERALEIARRTKKRVVVNFEEFDAVGKSDKADKMNRSSETATQTTWLILDQYKGDPRLFFAFTTNHFEKLNPIFRDRFRDSYAIEFPSPNQKTRADLIKMYLKKDKINLATELQIPEHRVNGLVSNLADHAQGMSIRSIENMIHSFKHYFIECAREKKAPMRNELFVILRSSKKKGAEVTELNKFFTLDKVSDYDRGLDRFNRVAGFASLAYQGAQGAYSKAIDAGKAVAGSELTKEAVKVAKNTGTWLSDLWAFGPNTDMLQLQ